MPDLDRDLLRKLAEWETGGAPVYSLYLDVDGRRSPRKQDYLARAQELCRRMGERATALTREDVPDGTVRHDTGRMMMFLEREFERGPTRGVALFSCAAAGLWQEVLVTRPVRDRAAVAEGPYLLPLEALVETYESFCTVLVDRSRARWPSRSGARPNARPGSSSGSWPSPRPGGTRSSGWPGRSMR